jgi:hypothetical protein
MEETGDIEIVHVYLKFQLERRASRDLSQLNPFFSFSSDQMISQ